MNRLTFLLVATLTLMAAAPVSAQIGGLPGGAGLPGVSVPGGLPADLPGRGLPGELEGTVRGRVNEVLQAPSRIMRMVRQSNGALEADPQGWPAVRGEIVAVDLSAGARERALAEGFTVIREERLADLEMTVVVLAPPRGRSLRQGVERLRRIDPDGAYDYNHVHAPAGEMDGRAVALEPAAIAVPAPQATGRRIGLIDTGVDTGHPSLAGVRVVQRGFAGTVTPGRHGSAVASLLAGQAGGFSGAAPGATLYAADVYGAGPAGGTAEGLARALSWMAENNVPVVNVSLVGPRNAVVEAAVRRLTARGHIVVAAVGNDGPAAPPLYPASYPGVVGVTGVNARDRVLPEAGRGSQVDFAAPGADMAAAAMGGGYTGVRGASFASPLVAGLLSARLAQPNAGRAQAAVSGLAGEARDLGARGADPVYGRGLVGGSLRVAPAAVGARGQLDR
ncbi:MAG: S8 family serine peptidase [Pseudomonadota bacterium]